MAEEEKEAPPVARAAKLSALDREYEARANKAEIELLDTARRSQRWEFHVALEDEFSRPCAEARLAADRSAADANADAIQHRADYLARLDRMCDSEERMAAAFERIAAAVEAWVRVEAGKTIALKAT